MTLHAHIGNEKKRFHKKQGYGGHYYTKCAKGNPYSIHPMCTNQLLRVMELGAYEPNTFPITTTKKGHIAIQISSQTTKKSDSENPQFRTRIRRKLLSLCETLLLRTRTIASSSQLPKLNPSQHISDYNVFYTRFAIHSTSKIIENKSNITKT
jgi:hypothetical protein